MATVNKITEIIAGIKTIYPYYSKETNVEMLVKTWTVLLKNYPDEAVDVAFFKCLQTCKMPPTPADVIEQLNAMIELNEETDEELWSVYTKAIRKVENELYYIQYPYYGETPDNARDRITKVWDNLPERLRQYIGSKGELMRIARSYTDDELKFEKTRFLKTLPTIKKREEYNELKLLLGDNKLLIEQGS